MVAHTTLLEISCHASQSKSANRAELCNTLCASLQDFATYITSVSSECSGVSAHVCRLTKVLTACLHMVLMSSD